MGWHAQTSKHVELVMIPLRMALWERGRQVPADRKIRRGIFALHDAGWSQRDIAKQAGISQPEVSRRLKRRALESRSIEPRDVILQRAAGQINTSQMLEQLSAMPLTVKTPGRRGAYDGAATITGTAKQLVNALQQGLLTEAEYEQLRTRRRAS